MTVGTLAGRVERRRATYRRVGKVWGAATERHSNTILAQFSALYSLASAAAFLPIMRKSSVGIVATLSNIRAKPAGSLGLNDQPVPGLTRSRAQPQRSETMAASPQSMPSFTVSPQVSDVLGSRRTSAEW